MNLLSHAFIARNHDDDRYLLGTSLPDLLPMYNRALRVERLVDHLMRAGSEHEILLAGIADHLEADRLFHASDFFLTGQRLLRTRLQSISGIAVKRFFLAHILFEMLLDRFLIKEYPEFLTRYYRIYSSHHCAQLSGVMADCFSVAKSEFADFLAKFLASRFLASYRDLDQLTARAARVAARVGRGQGCAFEDAASSAITAMLGEVEIELAGSIAGFFATGAR